MSDHAGEPSSLLLDDDTFIAIFERGGFGGHEFPHKAHLRMAWLYVTRFGTAAAVSRAATGIRTLAAASGKANLYHDTVTRAWIYLVAEAVTRSPSAGFEDLLARNPQLLDKRLLFEYYSPDVLSSEQARAGWIAPDRMLIPS